jgi:PIN domain nuclease of toxin-antitoxin system
VNDEVYVTDTHPLIWFSGGQPRKLGRKARALFEAFEAGEIEIRAPVPVVIETWFLARNGTIKPKTSLSAWWRDTTRAGVVIEPLLGEDVLVASDLDWAHRDPFDRMIVAMVQRLDHKLITIDESIAECGLVEVVW